MKRLHISAGGNKNIITSVGLGLLSALIISIVLTILQTSLIDKGKMNDNGLAGVFLIRIIATAIGGLIGSGLSGSKSLLTIVITAATYFVVLLVVGIVLFDDTFQKFWMGVLSVVIGAVVALLIKLKSQTTRKKAFRFNK